MVHAYSKKRRACLPVLAAFGLAVSLSACNPIVAKRGYIPDEMAVESIGIGVDNKESVYQRLGSPSTTATFNEEVWYYISSRHEARAFFAPKVTEREVLAVFFGEDDMVADIGKYGLEDGQVVAYVERKTPTRGKELGFLEQIFGNLGRLPAPGAGNQ